ncbi:MAG: Lrp/AsnC family transcriptional regulator [Thermoplasmatales archaeon]|nr:Lrp/AsnC family transcriptional regulator [Thermoplasmatales archaeon]
MAIDTLDIKIIKLMIDNARISWKELGNELGLSAPAAAERVHQLQKSGIIEGFTANVSAESMGLQVIAFIAVNIDRPHHRAGFLESIKILEEVQECHHIAGDDDYLLKVRCRDNKHLDFVVNDTMKGIPGVIRTRTTIVLSTAKETIRIPLKLEETNNPQSPGSHNSEES